MTVISSLNFRNRAARRILVGTLVALLVAGIYVVWPSTGGQKFTAYLESAVGLYPADDVRVAGVPVGRIDSIEPRADDVKVTMTVRDDVMLPADVRAIVVAPNIVSARFIQFAPAYTGGATLPTGATLGRDRTGVPVEWDEVKTELTKLSSHLGPQLNELQGPLSSFVNQAADTFDGNGDSFRTALRELSQTAGRFGDSRGDLFGTVKNLQILVDALSSSNEQIVQFSGHVASVSQVLADSAVGLDDTLGTLNQALVDVRGFLNEN
ncbi:MAG TPA: MCE family protein, partial [Mycobacterium sp.]|nr:MCE family protein [Mycobacterium sp.]